MRRVAQISWYIPTSRIQRNTNLRDLERLQTAVNYITLLFYRLAKDNDARARAVQMISDSLSRLHVLVVGPGLGRDENIASIAREIIIKAKSLGLYMVVDAVR